MPTVRASSGARNREEMTDGETAKRGKEKGWEGVKKRAHGATCRSCRAAGDSLGKHSGDRCDATRRDATVVAGGGGGYQALFCEELASLSLKRNTIKSVFLFRGDAPRCVVTAILFFTNLPIFTALSPRVTFSPRSYISPILSLFSIQLLLRSLACLMDAPRNGKTAQFLACWIVKRLVMYFQDTIKTSYYVIIYFLFWDCYVHTHKYIIFPGIISNNFDFFFFLLKSE